MASNNTIKNSHQAGFTLIEILVAITIFAIVIVAATGIFLYIVSGAMKVKKIGQLKQNGNLVLAKLERAVRDAQVMQAAGGSDCDGTQTERLYIEDESGVTKEFVCQNNLIMLNGTSLIDETVEIVDCSAIFQCYADPPRLHADFNLRYPPDLEENFTLWVSKRNVD
ncbi:type II secretion system GspH family protein [Patescibacteria group bacterium]|nr:type II secretion system GspH family protein [Patescibacteria group bacterium]MBU1931718.1 type II secretion system GspH family protein [Patescibacteria group bacterium]